MFRKNIQFHIKSNLTDFSPPYCSQCNSIPSSSSLCNNAHQSFSHTIDLICSKKRKKRSHHVEFARVFKNLLIYASIALIFFISLPTANCLRHLDSSLANMNTNIDTTNNNNKSASEGIIIASTTPLKKHEKHETNGNNNQYGSYDSYSSRKEVVYDDKESSEEEQYDDDEDDSESLAIFNTYVKQHQESIKNEKRSDTKKSKNNHNPSESVSNQHHEQSTCSSNKAGCMEREDIEVQSIKKHLLAKLGMQVEPNSTRYPKLKEAQIRRICKNFHMPTEVCMGPSSENREYQADDAENFQQHYNAEDYYEEDDEDENDTQFSAREKRIYAFPSPTSKRHKMYLDFKFSESQKRNNLVTEATLNLYIFREKNTLRTASTSTSAADSIQFIDVEISIVPDNTKSSHKRLNETIKNISVPKSKERGDYIQLNVTSIVSGWFQSEEKSHGIYLRILDSAMQEPISHKIVSLDANHFLTRPYIDIDLRDQRKQRAKRSPLNCAKGSNETRCCRHELVVDFDKFGWDWVIAPKKYDASYCSGECKIAFNQQYPHTHVMQLSTSANPCCSPSKMGKIMLLYFDTEFNIVLSTIPNMKVEECFCS